MGAFLIGGQQYRMAKWFSLFVALELATADGFSISTSTSATSTTTNHSCAILGCGGASEECRCDSSCISFDDSSCCFDFEATCAGVAGEPFELRDVNIFITTDMHSWISGRQPHDDNLNASLADVVDAVEAARQAAAAAGQDVFFFDNGDIQDGTGLSATTPDHVDHLAPLLAAAPYDALNCGNHELYQLDGGGAPPLPYDAPACGVVGLNRTGYIAGWEGRYLTSNIAWASSSSSSSSSSSTEPSSSPVGSRFVVARGAFGRSLLVLGFLYDMTDHCNAVSVTPVAAALEEPWFAEAVAAHAPEVSAVVVLAHMDNDDAAVDLLVAAVQAAAAANATTETKAPPPVLVLSGHSHQRKFRIVGNSSSPSSAAAAAFEAGCKLDTLGFASFFDDDSERKHSEGGGEAAWDLFTTTVDGNTAALARALSLPDNDGPPASAAGDALREQLQLARAALALDEPLGGEELQQRLRVDQANLTAPDALWTFYMKTIVPATLFRQLENSTSSTTSPSSSSSSTSYSYSPSSSSASSSASAVAGFHILGTGALSYDLFPGAVTLDDAYKTSPFGNWYYKASPAAPLNGSVLTALVAALNNDDEKERSGRMPREEAPRRHGSQRVVREAEDEVTLPLYVASDDALDPATEYALLYVDFDAPEIEAALLKITGVNYTAGRELFWTGHNDTSIIADYFSS
jgi:hypothetical protein